MPNTSVSAVGGALPAWLPTAGDAARSILHTVTRRLDGLRSDVERELVEHARCRRDVEALIDRLISGLDEVDGDENLEDFAEGEDLEGDVLDAGELTHEDAAHEVETPEWRPSVPLKRIRPAAGIYASFKRGQLVAVRTLSIEGRCA